MTMEKISEAILDKVKAEADLIIKDAEERAAERVNVAKQQQASRLEMLHKLWPETLVMSSGIFLVEHLMGKTGGRHQALFRRRAGRKAAGREPSYCARHASR